MPDEGIVDYLSTWNGATGDLYFFRTPRQESETKNLLSDLCQLPVETGEPTLIKSMGSELPVLSVYRPAVVSPDGAK